MLKWAVTARGSATSTSGSGLSGSTLGGGATTAASRAAAWPTYEDVSAAEPGDVSSWSTSWFIEEDHVSEDDDDEDRDSLSAYDDNASTLEQMMTIDFNDDSQVTLTHNSAASSVVPYGL